ncbi:MAG: copper-binding protein [Pyrinomonadaceae bacterium]|nr:copper-binding protein [Pyrinomonadaceae bacterium]
MKRKYLILLCLSLTVSACRQTVSETKNQNVKPLPAASIAPTNSNSSFPVSTPDATKIKIANGKGIVTKINLDQGSVELDHEEIKDVMPPMKMEFFVKEKAELKVLKVGDKVDFVLEENFGQEKIISIKKTN